MITRLLVANRGEIARRVFRTCRELGVETVAVFSDADAGAPHVREAGAAVRLAGDAPADTYLRGELLVKAALAAGADAVHPGYGFLSENAEFAAAVVDAGLTWVGPSPEAIAAMGSKVAAKQRMSAAGVPVLPELAPDAVTEADLPVIVKASAGGGGRGMRIVRDLAALPGEVAAAQGEAASAFGDPTVFCERYLETGRHIEVQVLADAHGTVWTLGERECSIQRRHQKVVEETPSPFVDGPMRAALCEAAAAAARTIGYAGAGTVEFMAAPDGSFYFLEMNTRLQVEHPVTECVFGLDLVRLQLEVAEGEALPAAPPGPRGHAVEVRLYAEDPAAGWRPQTGVVQRLDIPDVAGVFAPLNRPGVRLDSGVEAGSVVSTFYDPMLAKVIAWAPTRTEAVRRLAASLAGARLHGLTTNRDLLVRVLRHPAFLAGDTDTGFLDRHGLTEPDGSPGPLARPLADERAEALSALAAALSEAAANRRTARVLGGLPSGWRNLPSQPQRKAFTGLLGAHEVAYRLTRDGLHAEGFEDVRLVSAEPGEVVLEADGVRHALLVARYGERVEVDSALGPVTLTAVPRFADPADHVAAGSLLAPMPGSVVSVLVAEGDPVERGAPLLVLEAMKMQHSVPAPADGVVASLRVRPGTQVEAGAVLAVVVPAEDFEPSEPSEPEET